MKNKVIIIFVMIGIILISIGVTFYYTGKDESEKSNRPPKEEKTEELELIGEKREEIEIPSAINVGTLIDKSTNCNAGNYVIGNLRISKPEGKDGYMILADVKNISTEPIVDQKVTIHIYNQENIEMLSFEGIINLLPSEYDSIQQVDLENNTLNISDFKKYQVTIS